MATLDPATSLTTAEQALRDLIGAVMYAEHGANWMDIAVDVSTRQRWQEVRAQEAQQRAGHTLANATDISYAYLGDLVTLIKTKGNWTRLFNRFWGTKRRFLPYWSFFNEYGVPLITPGRYCPLRKI